MKKELNISIPPILASDLVKLKDYVSNNLKIDKTRITGIVIRRRSIDARKSNILVNLGLDVYIDEKMPLQAKPSFIYPDVSKKTQVIIVGAGPAGLFAALHLIELGYKPVILERGKTVSDRKRDIAAIHREHLIDP